MEFHKNQVAWDAPDAGTVKLAKPDYSYLANALNSLAKDSEHIADAEQKRLDDALAADMNNQLNLANDDIENARSDTGDFDYLGEHALSRLQGAFNQYDEATRRRFLRDNPHYMDNAQLAVTEKINKKKCAVIENGVKLEMPQWASTAAMIGTKQARQDMILKIQDRLGNISDEVTVNNMTYAANQMFDKYNVAALLYQNTTESLDRLEKLLKNNKELTTLTPEERIDSLKDVNSARKELAKQKEITSKNPQAKAIVEAYALLRQNGFGADAERIYNEVLNTQNTLIKTSDDGLEIKINDEVLPLYFALNDISATDRAEIAKQMEAYDKMDPRFLREIIEYGNTADDLLRKYTEGYTNEDSTQSMAIAGLEDIMSNYRMFKELPNDKQKQIERIIRQTGEAKDEIMATNSMPFRKEGVFWNNGAARVYSGDIAAGYLVDAAGLPMSPVPAEMKSRNKQMEDLFQMSFVNPDNMTQAERDIYDRYSIGNKIANAVIYGETRGGDALVDYMLPVRDKFYKDIDDNTNGEYTLLVWGAMDLLKKHGALDGTRFDAPPSTYRKIADTIIGNMKANNSINNRTTDEVAKDVIDAFRMLAGKGTKLTDYEEKVIQAISDGAASAQINRDAGGFINWWDKNMGVLLGGRDKREISIPSNAKPSPALKSLYSTMEELSSTNKSQKATKTAETKIKG